MNEKYLYSEKITTAIEQLSTYESFKKVCHQQKHGELMPSTKVLDEIVVLTRSILFPGYFGNASINIKNIHFEIGLSVEKLYSLLSEQILAGLCFMCNNGEKDIVTDELRLKALTQASDFIVFLPQMRDTLITDVKATFNGDPAATSYGEIIFCYPAIRAITNYRIAHQLLKLEVPIIPRIITEMAHSETGIDIHPGAEIGDYFTIDHGTGVVIGATAIIGNHVQLYQGVTLGAKSFPLDKDGNPIKGIPRHPILEDNVIIYANSTILGRVTIGEGSVIGGNLWVTNDVPKGARILQSKTK